jgi:hypothetical protein
MAFHHGFRPTGNQRYVAPVTAEPFFNQTTLLLNGNGTNGAQNNTFLDSSPNNFSITRNGNTTQGTFSPFSSSAGYWSYSYNSDTYQVAPASTAFDFSGDFTIEVWFYMTVGSRKNSIITRRKSDGSETGGWMLSVDTSNNLVWSDDTNAGTNQTIQANISLNTWHHVAVSRVSGTINFYVNGTRTATKVSSYNYTNTNSRPLFIGLWGNFGGIWPSGSLDTRFAGYISNIRILNTTGLYSTATIPVPTAPLTAVTGTSFLALQDNRFKDNSTNNLTITPYNTTGSGFGISSFSPFAPTAAYNPAVNGGAGYFDGVGGDYIQSPTSSEFAFGTGDFTWEAWIYPQAYPNDARLIDCITSGGVTVYPSFIIYNSGLYWHPASGNYQNFNLSVPLNAWSHVAVVRQSGVVYGFLNGVRGSTSHSYTTSLGSDRFFRICNDGQRYRGFMSNIKISNTAVYTSNTYTVPTAPMVSDSNTKLLLNFTNAGIFDATGKNVLETLGDSQIDTTVKKYGTGSMEFDGTGDYLSIPNTKDLDFGTGNFTIECWFYIAGNSNLNGNSVRDAELVSSYTTTGSENGYRFSIGGNNTTTGNAIRFGNNLNGSYSSVEYTGTVSQNTWHHVAVSRSGTTTKIFFNGSEVASGTLTNSNVTNHTYPLRIGALLYASNYLNYLNGFIDDLRITKGVARYTANFTPPEKELERR